MQYFLYLLLCSNFILCALAVELIEDGFDKPIFVTSFPNNNQSILVLEQKGIIRLIKNGKLSKTPFLNIKDRVHLPLFPGDEMGMLGFAFDPKYNDNGYFYVNYVDKDDYTIISRFKTSKTIATKKTEKIILKFKQPYSNHNGGHIEFGSDRFLYIAIGDGGSKGDPENRAQNLKNYFGTILRIDVDTELDYLIPVDNPFYNHIDVKKEIWVYGLRNPWRFSFDRLNGDMYIADVGQNLWEEINVIPFNSQGGQNFGWNIYEGNHCYPSDKECEDEGFMMPIFEYPNNANYAKTLFGIKQPNMDGCSVTGGYVYRGENIPEMYGRYIFGDYCTGKIWSILIKGNDIDLLDHTEEILESMGKREFYLSSFGEDNNGEIYLVDYNGTIYKLIEYN